MAGLNNQGERKRKVRSITGGKKGQRNLTKENRKSPGKPQLEEPAKVKGFTLFLSTIDRLDQFMVSSKGKAVYGGNASALARDLFEKFLSEEGF